MKEPNFFIVGAAKAGTTSIRNILNQCTDIFMSPIKEPHYFSKDIKYTNKFDLNRYFEKDVLDEIHVACISDKEQYFSLFKNAASEKIVGEASVGYLYSENAAKEIYEYNPKSKILIILRNPIERAFSHWLMDLRGGVENEYDFMNAIKKDNADEMKYWGNGHLYLDVGMYYAQVKRYIDIFPSNQIKIFLYDDFRENSDLVIKEILNFLNVEETIPLDTKTKHNKAELPKSTFMFSIFKKIAMFPIINKLTDKKTKKLIRSVFVSDKNLPKLTEEDRNRLYPYFKDDITNLEKLIRRDLSIWKL